MTKITSRGMARIFHEIFENFTKNFKGKLGEGSFQFWRLINNYICKFQLGIDPCCWKYFFREFCCLRIDLYGQEYIFSKILSKDWSIWVARINPKLFWIRMSSLLTVQEVCVLGINPCAVGIGPQAEDDFFDQSMLGMDMRKVCL